MPVNVLRKKGARMSLQEALERVEKLKRLMESSNPHEAALAKLRLEAFDVEAARAQRTQVGTSSEQSGGEDTLPDIAIEVLDALPEVPYREIGELEAHQPSDKKKVNWDTLHFELLDKAKKSGADAIVNIQLLGTVEQKILAGTALKYLNPKEIMDQQELTRLDREEEAHEEAQKERRDENTAPDVG